MIAMFLPNKYTKWYYTIIKAAKDRLQSGYLERHHIIPVSLGGTNASDNLVRLTAKEHFICHRLLVRMTTGLNRSKMAFAAFRMTHRSKFHHENHYITSKTYEQIRRDFSKACSDTRRGKRPYEMTDKTRKAMSIAAKSRPARVQSEEEKCARSINQQGRSYSAETIQRMKASALKRPKTVWVSKEESILKIPESKLMEYLDRGFVRGRKGFVPASFFGKAPLSQLVDDRHESL